MMAKPHIVTTKVGERNHVEYVKPEAIVKVRSKRELEKLLEWYSYPFIKHRVPDNPKARRRYVERVRPALRWFCAKFEVPVPEWLKGNAHYEDMAPDEFEDFFGPGPFRVREFEPFTQKPEDQGGQNAGPKRSAS